MAAPSVSFMRQELADMLPKYEIVADCLDDNVGKNYGKYLPQPNADDNTPENTLRYTAYAQRAIFYNVTARTLGGLTGQIFAVDPKVVVPTRLDSVIKDANGDGLSLTQSAQESVRKIIGYGRAGLYVDYPISAGPASKLQLDSGEIKPTITIYKAESIINWRKARRGAKHIYSLIVLAESVDSYPDQFTIEKTTQYKALVLKNPESESTAIYQIWIYKPDDKNILPEQPSQILTPQDAAGNPLREIPFSFVGAENNDSDIDSAPLYPMAVLNVGHYRNSADYEEACFVVGQPTYLISGLTEEWYEKVMEKKLRVGSRGGIPLPTGADGKILQVEPNTMAKEAMDQKEAQMIALGARLVESNTVQETATAATIANAADTSILANIANNVSAAYLFALQKAALFAGVDGTAIEFELNTEFAISRMSSADRAQLISEWQSGAITWEEMRKGLHESGVANADDAEAKAAIEADVAKKADQAAEAAKKLSDAVPPVPGAKPGGAAATK